MPKNASFEGGGMSFLVFNDRCEMDILINGMFSIVSVNLKSN